MQLYKKLIAMFIVFFHVVNYGGFSGKYNAEYGDIYEKFTAATKDKQPLNILFVVGRFPAPSQIFILNIITGLIDRGHNVFIFSFHKNSLASMHSNIEKYNLLDRVIYEKFPKKLECDVVFCQFGYLGKKIFEMSELSESLKNKKVVVCFRGSDTTSYLQKNANAYRKLFNKVAFCLPVCDYFRKKLIAAGCPAHKIAVHHSAIDCSQFFFEVKEQPQQDVIHLVSTCRLVKKKGIEYAIQAIAEVVKKYPNIHYTIVGDGPEFKYLQSLVQRLNLHKKVTLCGWKNQNELVPILRRSHIFLLPSIKAPDGNEEGIPNAFKEAMAMGLISIGTWHAGTPELIEHGKSGFLVAEKNVSQLADAIKYVIEHPDIWESVGLAARKKIEDEFETKQSILQLEKLFYKLLGR